VNVRSGQKEGRHWKVRPSAVGSTTHIVDEEKEGSVQSISTSRSPGKGDDGPGRMRQTHVGGGHYLKGGGGVGLRALAYNARSNMDGKKKGPFP